MEDNPNAHSAPEADNVVPFERGQSFRTTHPSYSSSLDDDAQTPPTIAVTTAAGCTWTAVSNDAFITIENGESGTGPGTVKYKVTKNNGNSPRTGTMTIAGRTFTVVQDNHEPE